ncbi:MAG: HDOD domain-containing protein [Bryobacterales bacterium]
MSTQRHMGSPSAPTKLASADYRKKLLSAVHLLPPLPTVLNQLLRILNDSNCTSGQIAAIIEKDPVLSGSVLRCVNSAYYGLPSRVSSIRHSVTLLGFATVRNLAMAFSMRQMLAKPKLPAKNIFADYSQHSLGCAIMTQFLAHYTHSQDPEAAFAAGLFHDIGKLLMFTTLPEMVPVVLEHWEESGGSFEESERELLHVTHSELSGIVLDKWKLPQAVRDACRYHHDPASCPEESNGGGSVSLAHLVHASDLYVKSYGLEVLPSEKRPSEPPDEAFRQIGLEDSLPELLERFKDEFQSIRDVFH